MKYHEPTLPIVKTVRGNRWEIHRIDGGFYARFVKHNSDTGPFATISQASDFIHLRGQ